MFASTRAGGTSRRKNLPQADIWRMAPDGSGAERMTFLSNTEMSPQFMRDGRVTMTTEKVDPFNPATGFYQLSGRRLNWDLTDYHPLLGQRAISPVKPAAPGGETRPSFDFQQVTEIREGFDGNFVVVLSDDGARAGAGTLGIFNRSVGPFESGRNDPGYLVSLKIPDPAATGKGPTQGAYRSPFPLLDGSILASYAAGNFDLTSTSSLDFDLVSVNPRTGARTVILAAPGAQVEAVLALAHEPRLLYYNRRQLVFGGRQDQTDPDHAIAYFPSVYVVATLLGSNLRRGRFIEDMMGGDHLVAYDGNGTEVGAVPLNGDGSTKIRVPAAIPLALGLRAGTTDLFRMSEEHQFGPGESISLGIPAGMFNAVCAGCHGSLSGSELDILVSPDVLTGASQSEAATQAPISVP